jgi:hypothetical protein
MEIKWIVVGIVLVMLGSFVGLGLEQYQQYNCKVSLASSGRTVEEIQQICK